MKFNTFGIFSYVFLIRGAIVNQLHDKFYELSRDCNKIENEIKKCSNHLEKIDKKLSDGLSVIRHILFLIVLICMSMYFLTLVHFIKQHLRAR